MRVQCLVENHQKSSKETGQERVEYDVEYGNLDYREMEMEKEKEKEMEMKIHSIHVENSLNHHMIYTEIHS